jgi:2'-5' RNA ligase
MRLFVALAISDEIRASVAGLIRDLRGLDAGANWVRPEQLHVTLKFIGEISAEQLPRIGEALETVKSDTSANLEFRGLRFFPNARRPAVIWAGIRASENVAGLADEINRRLEPLGIAREPKSFVPHLTIARLKQTRMNLALAEEIKKSESRAFAAFSTGKFHLIESKLNSSGTEYIPVRSFSFC